MKKSLITVPAIFAAFLVTGCSPQADVENFNRHSGTNTEDVNNANNSSQSRSAGNANKTPERSALLPQMESATNSAGSISGSSHAVSKPSSVRGIYISHRILVGNNLHKKESFLKNTRLNAIVVDIKDDSGNVFLDAKTRSRIHELKRQNIYTIARFVVFKDPIAAKHHPNWTIRTKSGKVWRHQGVAWVDPTNPNVQSYNLRLAKQVANLGVDEIQFDYIRFPDGFLRNKRFYEAKFTRSSVIQRFLLHATPMLHRQGVTTSADVFGLVTTAADDMGIGQMWEKMSPNVDYISPMMYPSHYSTGSYGTKRPVANPYTVIREGLKDAIAKNQILKKKGIQVATIRPWFQDFDMKANYNSKEVTAQITAARKLGVYQYLLWNQAGQYTGGTKF